MYRVVLIDDENIILEGLRRVVPWASFGCEVVGTAPDAEAGARLIQQMQPHILFTDIRMPGDDGLAMLAGLRSEFPHMQVTVLTGYRDFAYAQEAIRLGVARFLLKPSRMDEILEALDAMVRRLPAQPAPQTLPAAQTPDEAQAPGPEAETPAGAEGAGAAGSFIVNQALAYMQRHYQEKLTLQTVAQRCYVSQWHLSKLLNRYAQKSFYDILNGIRIQRAKQLLADPGLRIGEIGEMVGYADTSHFARTFKKLEGMSANEYRNSLLPQG